MMKTLHLFHIQVVSVFFIFALTHPSHASNLTRWHLQRITQRNPLTSDQIKTGKSLFNLSSISVTQPVTIYIVDSGIRITHHEFEGRAEYGVNIVNRNKPPSDCNGHGTHVGALAVGAKSGVARRARLVSVRVLDCQGRGTCSDLIRGLKWIINDIHNRTANFVRTNTERSKYLPRFIVVMSIGSSSNACSKTEQLTNELWKQNVVVVAAAGNDIIDSCTVYPVRSKYVLGVAATDSLDHAFKNNNYGKCVDIFAPGVNLLSAWGFPSDNNIRKSTGTSMAAPLVAGNTALMLSSNPLLTPTDIRNILMSSSSENKVVFSKVLQFNYTSSIRIGGPNRLLYVPWGQVFEEIRIDSIEIGEKFWQSSSEANETLPIWNSSMTCSSIEFSLQPLARPSMTYSVLRVKKILAHLAGVNEDVMLIRRSPSTKMFKNGSEPTTLLFKLYFGMNQLFADEYHRRLFDESNVDLLINSPLAQDVFVLKGGSIETALTKNVAIPKGLNDWLPKESGEFWRKNLAGFISLGFLCVLTTIYVGCVCYRDSYYKRVRVGTAPS